LLGAPQAGSLPEMRDQARRLLDAGAQRVLLKGGHLAQDHSSIDVFAGPEEIQDLAGPRVATRNTHGTGCALSSAIAALRVRRTDWFETVTDAKAWLGASLAAADTLHVGHGHGPVHHFHQLWDR
jgi:hydroxymethylpyrimidine/phosphomethylpyrimidine kinase